MCNGGLAASFDFFRMQNTKVGPIRFCIQGTNSYLNLINERNLWQEESSGNTLFNLFYISAILHGSSAVHLIEC